MVLLITNNEDVHADAVESWLLKWEVPYFRFHPDEIAIRYTVDFIQHSSVVDFKVTDLVTTKAFSPSSIGSVWYRRAKAPISHPNTSDDSKNFFLEELQAITSSIYSNLNHAKWINRIADTAFANDKVSQLKYAKQFGFEVPETLITNDVEKAYEFYCKHSNGCIVKSFRPTLIGNDVRVFTHKFSDNLKINDFASVKAAPTIFQALIEKAYDLRVTIVDDKIYAYRIYSQLYEDTKIDFRRSDMLELQHELVSLPKELEEKLFTYAKFFNLISCEFDFVETKNGDYVFLECNPNGQWLWIEIMGGANISEKMALTLSKFANYAS